MVVLLSMIPNDNTCPRTADLPVAMWQGMVVRTSDGIELGVVVDLFEEGPCSGRLRVHARADTIPRLQQLDISGTAVFAVPRSAIARSRGRILYLSTKAKTAYDRWLMHVMTA